MDAIGRYGLALLVGLATTAVDGGERTAAASGRGALTLAGASRGELLYENHCTVCHESGVHIRANRKAKSIADVRGWVERWSGELKLKWSREDIDDVTEFLARRYYKCDERSDKC